MLKKTRTNVLFKNSALVGIPPNMPAVVSLNICSKNIKKKKKRIEQKEADKRKPEPTGKGAFHQSHLENARDG